MRLVACKLSGKLTQEVSFGTNRVVQESQNTLVMAAPSVPSAGPAAAPSCESNNSMKSTSDKVLIYFNAMATFHVTFILWEAHLS